jgi:hypothetical protein
MKFIYHVIVAAHLLGMAALLGGWFSTITAPKVISAEVWGARLQLLTGIALVGLAESGAVTLDEPLDHPKVAVKLVIALVVAGLAEVLRRRPPSPQAHLVGVAALVNVLVAVLWT